MEDEREGGSGDRVKLALTIAPQNWGPRSKILHSKTKRLKFHRYIIFVSEFADGYMVFYYGRDMEDILKGERQFCGEVCMTQTDNRDGVSVADKNRM